ncbi:hypothetical protein [Actinomadura rupiterrae]|uniref:hypothetical protein n=1 Tax=Actinomadura rupiterrae TaxID=559627 RepID=UPI0020A3144E|nr:hypothetical protein [Actinomadura rupiterrae]MCP2341146.1 hypothetical protein [Actinomadura rupiterrae]
MTDDEMAQVTDAIVAAASPTEALAATVRTVYDALLAPLGESTADYGPDRRLQVTEFAIAADQNAYIMRALAAKTRNLSQRISILLDWTNLRPDDLPEAADATSQLAHGG